jgi:hypothetical protein
MFQQILVRSFCLGLALYGVTATAVTICEQASASPDYLERFGQILDGPGLDREISNLGYSKPDHVRGTSLEDRKAFLFKLGALPAIQKGRLIEHLYAIRQSSRRKMMTELKKLTKNDDFGGASVEALIADYPERVNPGWRDLAENPGHNLELVELMKRTIRYNFDPDHYVFSGLRIDQVAIIPFEDRETVLPKIREGIFEYLEQMDLDDRGEFYSLAKNLSEVTLGPILFELYIPSQQPELYSSRPRGFLLRREKLHRSDTEMLLDLVRRAQPK